MNLNFFKKKKKLEEPKPLPSPEQTINLVQVEKRHRVRISNLFEEFDSLSKDLVHIEQDLDIPTPLKIKKTNSIIQRAILLKYEIDIREDLLKCL